MAKINVTGNAVVLTSAIKYADIVKVKKYRPDALNLYNEEKSPVFKVDIGDRAQANEYGIVFDGKTHDESGYATYTQLLPAFEGNLSEVIADMYGAVILKLREYEAQFSGIIESIDREREVVLDTITLA